MRSGVDLTTRRIERHVQGRERLVADIPDHEGHIIGSLVALSP